MQINITDGCNDNEAVKIVNALKPFARNWFEEWGRSCVRSKKMTVTTAPDPSTGLIGVKDAFSDNEVFVRYMSSCAKAVVGNTVWCNWMYDNMQTLYADSMGNLHEDDFVPVTGGTFTGNVAFNGTVDVVNRRADASLSSAGWYTIIKYNIGSSTSVKFATAQILKIRMGTTYSGTNNCAHEVTMLATYGTNPRFTEELSRSNVNVIDKIRYRYDANNVGWIDVHYAATANNSVWMTFDVGSYNTTQQYWISQNFVPVDDAPSTGGTADTILTVHTFMGSTAASVSFTPTTGSSYSAYGNCYYAKDGNVIHVHIGMQGLTASTSTDIYTLPSEFRPKTTVVATGNGSGIATLARARVLSDGTIQVYSSATTALIDVIFICAL